MGKSTANHVTDLKPLVLDLLTKTGMNAAVCYLSLSETSYGEFEITVFKSKKQAEIFCKNMYTEDAIVIVRETK